MYQYYMTDALKSVLGLDVRFYDLVNRNDDEKVEERTSEEIIEGIKNKLRKM